MQEPEEVGRAADAIVGAEFAVIRVRLNASLLTEKEALQAAARLRHHPFCSPVLRQEIDIFCARLQDHLGHAAHAG
ncbi:MAG: hypothetical protein GX552_07845 [Chloroflexi bacterium]|nr:hypothetical protein [Chloroflexota bacterium]